QNEVTPMSKNRTPLILSAVLVAAFATSGAFAQDAATQQKTQSTPPQDSTQSQPADKAMGEKPKTWSDLDTDGNGSLSVAEAGALDSMAQLFAKADADGNGELTGEEYKAWLAANGGGQTQPAR